MFHKKRAKKRRRKIFHPKQQNETKNGNNILLKYNFIYFAY